MSTRLAIDTVTPRDRLALTLLGAAALHTVIIVGVAFVAPDRPAPSRPLEVTLTRNDGDEAPENADFAAASAQQRSGSLDTATERTTRSPQTARRVEPVPVTPPTRSPPEPATGAPITAAPARDAPPSDPAAAPEREASSEQTEAMLLERARALASTDARMAAASQLDAKGERVRRVSSVSARSSVEAAYLDDWRRRVERFGNLNYPTAARRRSLSGNLRVRVDVAANGALRDVRVLESSGYAILDDAVVRIVRLAAPFMPFPEDLRADTDVLQIVRTWKFRPRDGFASD